MPEPFAIEARNLAKRFGSQTILDGVDLDVGAGETVALIGPSGGGKSTLLRCLNGLCAFDAGEVRVGEHRLAASPSNGSNNANGNRFAAANAAAIRSVRRLLGMVFQDFQLFPHLSAWQNVAEAPRRVLGVSRQEARKQAQELLARVGLAHREDAHPDQLSGGQKQRVAIARALAMQPRGLLCDEITSALDPELKHEVLGVVADLKRDGMTLVLVTHEIGFARRAADRVVVLAEGKIIESGPPEQVLDAPQHPRTQTFLRQVMA